MPGGELALHEGDPGAALPAAPGAPGIGLSGRQKAAVMLIAVGAQNAAEVLKHLSEREVEALSVELAGLDTIDPAIGERVLEELAQRVIASEAMGKGGVDYAKSVLEHLLGPERALEVIQLVSDAAEGRPFDFLRRTAADQIAGFLVDETPQTIALIVANLTPGHGAKVLAELPTEMQADVALRIALMGETSPSVVRDVAQGLRDKLSNVLEHEYSSAGGVETLADLLNHAGRSTERNVLSTIGATHEDLAEEVRSRLFTFEDLHRLADRELQMVLREVDQKDLALALRGVPDWLMDKITSNMSSRAAELMREDIEAQAPQRKHVVEEAQGRIVAIVRRLEDTGTITLGAASEEEAEELV